MAGRVKAKRAQRERKNVSPTIVPAQDGRVARKSKRMPIIALVMSGTSPALRCECLRAHHFEVLLRLAECQPLVGQLEVHGQHARPQVERHTAVDRFPLLLLLDEVKQPAIELLELRLVLQQRLHARSVGLHGRQGVCAGKCQMPALYLKRLNNWEESVSRLNMDQTGPLPRNTARIDSASACRVRGL